MKLIQLDDNTIISPGQVLWAYREVNVERWVCQPVVVRFAGRAGEETQTVYDPCGRVWLAIRRHAEGNG